MSDNRTHKNMNKSKGVLSSLKRIVIFCSILFVITIAFFIGKSMNYETNENSERSIEGGENYEFIIPLGGETPLQSDNSTSISAKGSRQQGLSPNQVHSTNQINDRQSIDIQSANTLNENNAPSKEYLLFFKTVSKDYHMTQAIWRETKRRGYRTRENDRTINHYMNNIDNNLRTISNDKKNFNALSSKQKMQIKEFDRLADELERSYYSFPLQSLNKQQNNNPNNL